MENRFLGLIENSIKEHWDLPAFSDYNGHTYHYKDVAWRIEKISYNTRTCRNKERETK